MDRSTYRIIDANFNRAREALRVMEEFCRFALNSASLTARTKQIRHQLSGCIGKLDSAKLIASRDTVADVGIGDTIDAPLRRSDLRDSFTAACKRLTEALRVLAETIQAMDASAAQIVENLRYAGYTLEKDIVVFSDTAQKYARVRLYIIITRQLPADVFSLTSQCIAGGADCIQLRAKDIDDDAHYAMAAEFVSMCKSGGVLGVINDRVDIAVAADADGVHLGQNDLPIAQARSLQRSPLIIGVSTHSPAQLRQACLENPTYAALGPIFPTPTKPAVEAVGLDYITGASKILADTGIGHVAIGGITLENIGEVFKAGAKTVAVCSAVCDSADPAAMCREFKQKIADLSE